MPTPHNSFNSSSEHVTRSTDSMPTDSADVGPELAPGIGPGSGMADSSLDPSFDPSFDPWFDPWFDPHEVAAVVHVEYVDIGATEREGSTDGVANPRTKPPSTSKPTPVTDPPSTSALTSMFMAAAGTQASFGRRTLNIQLSGSPALKCRKSNAIPERERERGRRGKGEKRGVI